MPTTSHPNPVHASDNPTPLTDSALSCKATSASSHLPALAGIRTYYLNRSQPPLFSEMVKIVYQATDNKTLLA